jgi:NhaA family Na+:H+ antiporter
VTDRLDPPLEDVDHVLGPDDAPLELVMYGDFQCPYCLAAQSVLRRVRQRLDGRLRYAFRHLPIAEKHPMARASAEASEAAAAQGAFWAYHDALYAAQSRLSDRELVVIASDLGLETERLEREVREGFWAERVERDLTSAMRTGAQGTPTFFVNGVRYADVYDAGSLVAALESSAPA